MAVAVARPYLVAHRASTSDLDPRAMLFLGDAEKALAAGNLELAKENLDKASVLAEHDPRVLRAFARLAVIRADVVWLKNRLTPASDDPLLRERASTARKAVELAVASSPSDVLLVQLQVDALRIAGERDAARALVGKMNADSAQPETAYVLAALDMAESEPLWRTVLDRLHLALQGEGALGRARSALVYASVRAGDLETANAELDKLGRFAPGHPLLVDLRTFVLSAQAKSLVDAGADTHRPVHKTPARDAGGSAAKDPTARDRFEAALARNPNDPEALVGLGSLARRSGDTSRALGFFKRAVAANPSYLPALVGLADAYWDSGQRGEAVGIYRDIVERFPERSYPVHVKQRALASL
jgi:tetratricopeptide (TPR) repeat protein